MSSTLVEVGSEATSDATSTRNLDISDATLMDTTASESNTGDEDGVHDPSPVPKSVIQADQPVSEIAIPPALPNAAPVPRVSPVTDISNAQHSVPVVSIPLPPAFNSNNSETSTQPTAPSSGTTNAHTANITSVTHNGNSQVYMSKKLLLALFKKTTLFVELKK